MTVQGADQGDTRTLVTTAITAVEQVEAAHATTDARGTLEDIVADKGYHSNETMVDLAAVGLRSYIRNPPVAGAIGPTRRDAYAPVMGIAAVSGRPRATLAAATGETRPSDRLPTSMRPAGCDARTCGDTTTS